MSYLKQEKTFPIDQVTECIWPVPLTPAPGLGGMLWWGNARKTSHSQVQGDHNQATFDWGLGRYGLTKYLYYNGTAVQATGTASATAVQASATGTAVQATGTASGTAVQAAGTATGTEVQATGTGPGTAVQARPISH